MNKKTVLIACVCAFFVLGLLANGAQAESGQIKWHGYREGLSIAKNGGKKIFLYFHAPWCKYCKEMDKTTFANKEVATYLNDHFVPVIVDTDTDRKTARDYQVRALPANFFLTAGSHIIPLPMNGNLKVSQIPGYIPPEMFLKLIHFVGSDGYRTRTFRDFVKKP
jgi:thioredoxin-related protein